MAVTFQGNPLSLVGDIPAVGSAAPEVQLINQELAPVRLRDFSGKICVILSVPSLDTPVCDMETRTFNEHASTLGADVQIIAVSMDLPFAQKRWCAAAGVERVRTLSDYRDRQFGNKFGVMIRELGLLARAVFVIDRAGIVQYRQIVREITSEPNYGDVLKAIAEVAG